MKRLARATIAAVTVLGLGVPSIVGATSSITTSGPGAHTTVKSANKNDVKVKTNNNLNLSSNTTQTGKTGKVTTSKNTEAGDSASGDVTQDHSADATVAIDNSGVNAAAAATTPDCGCNAVGDILTSGPDATTKVETTNTNKIAVTTTNNVNLSNNVTQKGTTGDVKVEKNTSAGSATSGSVMNTTSSSFDISVTN